MQSFRVTYRTGSGIYNWGCVAASETAAEDMFRYKFGFRYQLLRIEPAPQQSKQPRANPDTVKMPADQVLEEARQLVYQWDHHDRYRVPTGESTGEPVDVAIARAFLLARSDTHKPAKQTIWRVRLLDCDGRRIGRTWREDFFHSEDEALQQQKELIADSNRRHPSHPYEMQMERVDSISGYCNWQFGVMTTVDVIEIPTQK